LRTISSGS